MSVQHRPPPGKYKLTIDDFLRLDDTGVFGTDRTELLDGDIIIMNAEYRPHAWIAGELGYRLRRAVEEARSELYVMSASVAVPPHDLPLPDLVLTREPRGPGPIPLQSVALIVEVSTCTLQRDRVTKATLFARAGVPEYWVVDVAARVIHRLWSPMPDGYAEADQTAFGEPLSAATMPAVTIGTDGL